MLIVETGPARPAQPVRVLVVEDERPLRRAFALNLEQRGYRVRDASDLSAALASCTAEWPDVLVLDVNLPDGTGWDLLRALAAQGKPQPAVVAVSAAMPGKGRLAEFCPVAFLPKPFPIAALIRAVERAAAKDCSREYPHHSAV